MRHVTAVWLVALALLLRAVAPIGVHATGVAANPRTAVLTNALDWHTGLTLPDGAGRLSQLALQGLTNTYGWQYDPSGNLQAITTHAVEQFTYTYGSGSDPNQLASYLDRPTGITTSFGGYDANGNPTTISASSGATPVSLTYDSEGRLATYTSGADEAILSYDAAGQRAQLVWQTSPGVGYTLRYHYLGAKLAQLVVTPTGGALAPECIAGAGDATGCTESFVYRADGTPLELLYTPTGGTTSRYWYEVDGRGNVVALTDATGVVVDQYLYVDAWGVPNLATDGLHAQNESVPQPLWYAGYLYDRELKTPGLVGPTTVGNPGGTQSTGWYWLSSRSYDPALERFIQPDPSEQEGTRSYVYCNDDPLDCTDPSGLLSWDDIATGIGIGLTVVGVGLVIAGTVATGGGLAVGLAGGGSLLGLDAATLTVAGPALVTAGAGALTGDPAFAGGAGPPFAIRTTSRSGDPDAYRGFSGWGRGDPRNRRGRSPVDSR